MKYNKREIMKAAWNMVKTLGYTISAALKTAWQSAKTAAQRHTLRVAAWVIDKAQRDASRYNIFIDFERDANGNRRVENGALTVTVEEKLVETEKAIRVRLSSGEVVGSAHGWTLWIPKSQIA